MADPPRFWRLGQARAKSVMRGCIRNAHREYISKMEEWQEKLHRAARAVVLGHEKAAETVSEERKWPVALGHLHALPPERLQLCYAQVDKCREQGRVVEVRRRIIFGRPDIITEILGSQQINTSYVERDNLTSCQSNGRLVRKTLSHSKKAYYLQRHLDLEDAVFNFV
jgi:hypothetical protein